MQLQYDCIVVGGGIAGLVCASQLAKQGRSCIVFEKEQGPFEKVCGGFVPFCGVQLLREVGIIPENILADGAVRINGVSVEKNKRITSYDYKGQEYGIGLHRKLLHRYLSEFAEHVGCNIQYASPVRNIRYDGAGYQIGEVSGRYAVMAIGTQITDDMSHTGMFQGQTFGISEMMTARSSLTSGKVYFWYPSSASRGYFWAIPIGHEQWNIGWWNSTAVGLREDFLRYRAQYTSLYFCSVETIRPPKGAACGCCDHTQLMPFPVYGIGDFSGNNDSETGAGIYAAIGSAMETAERIMKEIQNHE